jgi:hypothetical protein
MCVRDDPCEQLLSRVRGEYAEMPGLDLTVPQAVRFWGLGTDACEAALSRLTASGFLRRTRTGSFALATPEGRMSRSAARPAVRLGAE